MKLWYCWRCKAQVPMLDEAEFEAVWAAYIGAIKNMKRVRAQSRVTIAEAGARFYPSVRKLYRRFLAKAGFEELVLPLDHLISKHRVAAYGPPCTQCGLPLRSREAKLCAACGAKRAA